MLEEKIKRMRSAQTKAEKDGLNEKGEIMVDREGFM